MQGRTCGPCSKCCVDLSVKSHKTDTRVAVDSPTGVPCEYLCSNGCSVYEQRPWVCESYECLWRSGALKSEHRPDISGVLVEFDYSWSYLVTTYVVCVDEAHIDSEAFQELYDEVVRFVEQRTVYRSLVIVLKQTQRKGKKVNSVVFLPERYFTTEEQASIHRHYTRRFQNRVKNDL